MTELLVRLALAATIDAPVTEVTVFSDRARVVRTATATAAGPQTFELPLLPQAVDPRTIRVEATGAEVKRVELTRLEDDALPADEARQLIKELQLADDDLARLNAELAGLQKQEAALARISPQTPARDPLKPSPRLSAGGWSQAVTFVSDALAKLQMRQVEVRSKARTVGEKRQELAARAALLGAAQRRFGWKVVAQTAGGAPVLRLTYFVDHARWIPLYDLALNSDTARVTVGFSGLVSQESGEDWVDAALTLSTAVPSTAATLSKLLTWKIGEKERFVPTATPVSDAIRPAPPVPALPASEPAQDLLRAKLEQLTGGPLRPAPAPQNFEFEDKISEGDLQAEDSREEAKSDRGYSLGPSPSRGQPGAPAAAPPPAPMRRSKTNQAPRAQASETMAVAQSPSAGRAREEDRAAASVGFSLAPPAGYHRPTYSAELPAAAAGGYDLRYVSLQRETVQSGKGERKVALFTEAWPVSVERKLFPALFPEAFLVAELKNPSPQPLPAGRANLFVGDDPAGNARLKLVSPGETFTLPLGIDRALKPIRNVKVFQSEQGLINKDEITDYAVTIELANPYRAPVALRLIDQLPITTQPEVEIKLADSKPQATQDRRTGALEWRLTVAAGQKTIISFRYSVKRPKGWQLRQAEVRP